MIVKHSACKNKKRKGRTNIKTIINRWSPIRLLKARKKIPQAKKRGTFPFRNGMWNSSVVDRF